MVPEIGPVPTGYGYKILLTRLRGYGYTLEFRVLSRTGAIVAAGEGGGGVPRPPERDSTSRGHRNLPPWEKRGKREGGGMLRELGSGKRRVAAIQGKR